MCPAEDYLICGRNEYFRKEPIDKSHEAQYDETIEFRIVKREEKKIMKCSEINIRDPFVIWQDGTCYMYGTRAVNFGQKTGGFDV